MGSTAASTLAAQGRRALRVACEIDARLAWGYQERHANVIEFATTGLTLELSSRGAEGPGALDAPVGAVIVIELDLPRGTLALCGRVVHAGRHRSGVELLPAGPDQHSEMESYLWDLLSVGLKPDSECAIVGCERLRKARGLCNTHYARWRRRARDV